MVQTKIKIKNNGTSRERLWETPQAAWSSPRNGFWMGEGVNDRYSKSEQRKSLGNAVTCLEAEGRLVWREHYWER